MLDLLFKIILGENQLDVKFLEMGGHEKKRRKYKRTPHNLNINDTKI